MNNISFTKNKSADARLLNIFLEKAGREKFQR